MTTAKPYRPPTDVHPYANWLIRRHVRRTNRRYGLRAADVCDVSQELSLHAHVAADRYDSSRGAVTTFYDRVLTRRLVNILQARAAAERKRRRERPLDESPHPSWQPQPQAELKLDVANALSAMPQVLRRLAERFMYFDDDRAKAGRALGWTRGQVRHRCGLIARHLSDLGLAPESWGRGKGGPS